MAETKRTLDPSVKERLDLIDWDGLKNSFGVTREAIEKNPKVASQLVYGAMTDLVQFNTGDISGEVSLRAFPTPAESKDLWKVKGYTKQEEKSEDQKLFFYGEEIYSKAAKKALFEKTSWMGTDKDGKQVRKYGNANASTGIPVAFAFKKRDENGNVIMGPDGKPEREPKRSFILSIHQPTNQIVGIAVDKLKERLQNSKNGVSMYGVKLTDEQINQVANGGAVILKDCKNKKGESFNAAVQFDVSQMTLVPVHPTALKQAERMGADLGIGKNSPSETTQKVENKPAKKSEKKAAPAVDRKPKTRLQR